MRQATRRAQEDNRIPAAWSSLPAAGAFATSASRRPDADNSKEALGRLFTVIAFSPAAAAMQAIAASFADQVSQ
jgi:hypothetical protein